MSGREKKRSADHMRLLFLIFVTAVCVLFLLKLRWPKTKSIYYDQNTFCIYCLIKLQNFTLHRIHFHIYFFWWGVGEGGGLLSRVQYI